MHPTIWRLPEQGIFEFDFVCLSNQPDYQELTDKDEILAVLEWFEMTYEHLKLAAKINPKTQKEAQSRIGSILSECFRGIAEYFVFNSETLGLFIDLIDDAHWKFGVYMAGVGRMCDYTNFDFIKHRMKNKRAIEMAYQSFGVLNMFSPFRANGAYLLKLDVFEEKQVLKMLFELCKGEGWSNMKDAKLNGKPVEAVN